MLDFFPFKLTFYYHGQILGADVGHPGPGIAKPFVTDYAPITDIQLPRVEVIELLQQMMEQKHLGDLLNSGRFYQGG